ncbi:MAG: hypothetical protein N838_22350 [Thiohalocapsa sp. PB-PSB1]|jgi:hypothetical protein|nr:MAG: hypothetical protein N838_22350 [Thiohalocapsa sp. PB-PSB1]
MGRKSRVKKERRIQKEKDNARMIVQAEKFEEAIIEESTDEQLDRILNILGVKSEEDAEVSQKTIQYYYQFLSNTIEMPCLVTGIEDMGCFSWEEYYTFGPGDEREYEQKRKDNPSFRDEYKLISFNKQYDEESGILVDVERVTDKKKFTLTLSDLKAVNKRSKNHQLLDDYSVWFVNYAW